MLYEALETYLAGKEISDKCNTLGLLKVPFTNVFLNDLYFDWHISINCPFRFRCLHLIDRR